jgi:lipopolysaccharide export system protein LptC
VIPRDRASIALVAILAGVTWWYQYQGESTRIFAPELSSEPDYYLDNFSLVQTDETGILRYRLRAERMSHLELDGTSEFEAPVFVFHRPPSPEWEISSERAWASPNAEEVHLLGGVTLHRAATTATEAIHILTSNVRLWPETQTALTDESVIATSGQHWIRGIGMSANMAEGNLDLLSHVRAHYVP